MFGGSAAPGGWVLCDGTSYSRTGFSALFSIISTFYGSIDGSSFNVPDLRARFPLGKSAATSLGTVAGASTQTLTAAQLPAHNHTATGTATQGNHTHTDSGHAHSCTTPQHNHGMDHLHQISAGQFSHQHLIGQYAGYTPGGTGFYSANAGSDVNSQAATLPAGSTNSAAQAGYPNTGNSNQSLAFTSAAAAAALSTVSAGAISVTVSVANSTGGGGSFAIMPPYLIVNYIIKT
jgi:microcystin-dependent protein